MKKEQDTTNGIKEIARRAGVSIGTVDRVINNRIGVSATTKEKILKIIEEMDYRPNIMARMLASKKVIRIAVLIPEVSNETGYWNAPLNGINEAASEIRNFGVSVDQYFFDQNAKQTFIDQCAIILNDNYDGLVLAPMFEEESNDFLRKCHNRNLPFVLINSDLENHSRVAYIGPDLFQSGFLAAHLTKYLITKGQRVLVVNISREISRHHHLLRKEDGFVTCMQANNASVQIDKTDINETGYEAIRERLIQLFAVNKPNVVFVTNSRVSSVARFFDENRIDDVVLIGYDFLEENIAYLRTGTIDFLICQKPQEQGYKGLMSMYQHLLNLPAAEHTQYMPIDIITKENYLYYKN